MPKTDLPKDIRSDDFHLIVERLRKVKPFQYATPKSKTSKPTKRQLNTGISPYDGPWESRNVAHLLKRTLFGFTKNTQNEFKAFSPSQAVDQLLIEPVAPNPPINNYEGIDEFASDPHASLGNTWVEAPYHNDIEGYRIMSLKAWILENMINQEDSLQEKMVLFWHNLLVTQFFGVFISKASYQYYQTLREHAFGNFKDLIKAITLDPAMLVYLNGSFNNKYAPDENYARELQELFCIGKGPGSGYTEGDVQAAARVLTGFVLKWDTFEQAGKGESEFYPDWHDTSNKQFSSFYGNRIIEGKSGMSGADELDELLDMIFETNELALYICRRLYNFFVFSEADEQAESQVIEPLAQIFRDNNYNIKPVIEALLKSEHFHDEANHGVLIKSPIDFLIGSWKALKMEIPSTDIQTVFRYHLSHLWVMAEFGQEMGDPPSVAGWPAYYQTPQYDKSWITTDSITNRAEIMDLLTIYAWYASESDYFPSDLLGLLEDLDDPYDPNNMLQEIIDLFLGIPLSDEGFATLKDVLLAGNEQDYYWTNAYTAYINNPGDEEAKNVAENRIKEALRWLFQAGEFQLM